MEQLQVQLRTCPACAAQMPDTAAFCPGCGRSMQEKARARGKVGALPENIASTIAYFTFLPAVAFLFIDPYRRNRFVRFHALQCLMYSFAAIAIAATLRLAALVLMMIPVLGPLLVLVIGVLFGLAAFMIWLVLVIKAFQGEMFEVPILGRVAAQYADPS